MKANQIIVSTGIAVAEASFRRYKPRVFISYRCADTQHAAGRLTDTLKRHSIKCFIDIEEVHPGVDFRPIIRKAIGNSWVLIVLIGPKWVAMGRGNLDDDWAEEELLIAWELGKPVIPVLVDEAKMPRRSDLPDVLAPLATIYAVPLRYESFSSDADRVLAIVKRRKRRREWK